MLNPSGLTKIFLEMKILQCIQNDVYFVADLNEVILLRIILFALYIESAQPI